MYPFSIYRHYFFPFVRGVYYSAQNRYGVCASACDSGEIPPARVSLDVGRAIVVRSSRLLNPRAPLLLQWVLLDQVFQIEVPELKLQLGCRANRRKHGVASVQGPPDNVGYVTRKPTCNATGRGSASILKKDEILEEDSHKSLMSFLL
jgi:hypothetical protein